MKDGDNTMKFDFVSLLMTIIGFGMVASLITGLILEGSSPITDVVGAVICIVLGLMLGIGGLCRAYAQKSL
jgi:hypothetical protein